MNKAKALCLARERFGSDAVVWKFRDRFSVAAGRTGIVGVWNILGYGASWESAIADAGRDSAFREGKL